jgi:hypothetical protein
LLLRSDGRNVAFTMSLLVDAEPDEDPWCATALGYEGTGQDAEMALL